MKLYSNSFSSSSFRAETSPAAGTAEQGRDGVANVLFVGKSERHGLGKLGLFAEVFRKSPEDAEPLAVAQFVAAKYGIQGDAGVFGRCILPQAGFDVGRGGK